jgi:hypothetical protein
MRQFFIAMLGVVLCLASVEASAQEISARAATIRFGGRMHAQYSASSASSSIDDFFFRRVRLIADIDVTDFFSARVQPDFAGGKALLQDAYVRLNFSDNLRISMGQFKRAFDLFELSSSTDLSIIERDGRVEGLSGCTGVSGVCSYSRLTEKLEYAARDQGIRLEASGGSLSFLATMTNGTGINVDDENGSKSYAGRLTLAATANIRVSGQYHLHDYAAPAGGNEYAGAWSVDVEVGTWRDGLHVQAAVTGGDNWKALDPSGDAAPFTAFQAVVSYYIPVEGSRFIGVEPLGRVSYADPDGDTDDDGAFIFTPGLMAYIQGRTKLGVNLDVFSPQTGNTEYSFKAQAFLYF